MCAWVLSRFSCVQLYVTLWTVAHQAPLSTGILQARAPEWGTMPFSRGSSRPREDLGNPNPLCLLHWQAGFYHCKCPPGTYTCELKSSNLAGKIFFKFNTYRNKQAWINCNKCRQREVQTGSGEKCRGWGVGWGCFFTLDDQRRVSSAEAEISKEIQAEITWEESLGWAHYTDEERYPLSVLGLALLAC